MLTHEELGKRIKELREQQGRTQEDLAKKLDIKRELVSRIESGKRSVNYLEMKGIADFLGVTPEELVRDEEDVNVDLVTLFMQNGCEDEMLIHNVREIQELLDVMLGQEWLYRRLCEGDDDGEQ